MSNASTIAAIDPGASGAIVFLCLKTWVMELYDMPHYWEEVKGKRRKRVDTVELAALLKKQPLKSICTERVHAMPEMDVKSIFSFGRFYGQLEMSAAMAGVEFKDTDPAVWKRRMNVSSDKDLSRQRAGQLVPAAVPFLTRKTDHDRAEAILLALHEVFTLGLMPRDITIKADIGATAPKQRKKRGTNG